MLKINLLDMILGHAGEEIFHGLIIDDDGKELDAVDSLDCLIMEYAKVRDGGHSDIVTITHNLRPIVQSTITGKDNAQ